jgi:hypothetical protein
LKQAENKLRTFEKIQLYKEYKIKKEFEKMEHNIKLQYAKEKMDVNRLAKRRAYMAKAREDIKDDFLSGGNQSKSNFLKQDRDERVVATDGRVSCEQIR